ncbi:MAG TPA: siphovirus Gp157 family protein [Thermoleophilia bacterium]|nr:siphovirus Gp157 family protein [Thermoleophilia bacterium]
MGSKTLFEISDDMQAFDALLEDADFESPEVQEALAKWASELQGNLEDKVDNYAAFITTLLARAEARKAEATRLLNRSKRDTTTAASLKDHLKRVLEFRKIKSLDTPRYKVTVARAGGKVPVECTVLGPDLPAPFQRVKPAEYTPDLDIIREHLEQGNTIPGCRLLERSTYLKIT